MRPDAQHPIGESELLKYLQKKKVNRRTFTKGLLALGSAVATGIATQSVFDFIPTLTTNLVLTPEEERILYKKISGKKTGLGFYPDFDLRGDDAIADAKELRKEHEDISQVGIFALLEDINRPEVMATHHRRIQTLWDEGFVPQISLGVSSVFKPHPFDERHTTTLCTLMDLWVDFLARNSTKPVHIRFLYEANTYGGDIAYKNNGYLSQAKHQDQFKFLFEYFERSIRNHKQASGKLLLDISFAASGASMINYLPDSPVRAAGVDIYPEGYGRLAISSLYEHVFSKTHSALKNNILVELLHDTKKHFGSSTLAVLHEIGTTDTTLDWFKTALLLFLAADGEEILYFGYDKTLQEKMNYKLTLASRSILHSVNL